MARPHADAHGNALVKHLPQAVIALQREREPDVGIADRNRMRHLGDGHDMDAHADAGIFPAHGGHGARQDAEGRTLDAGDGDFAAPQALERIEISLDPSRVLENGNDVAGKHLARRRELEAVGQPVEQRRAGFKLDVLAADGGRRHVELARGFTDRTAAADGVEVKHGARMDADGHALAKQGPRQTRSRQK